MANLASLTIATKGESMSKSKHDPDSVDEYLGSLPEYQHTSLQELRRLIKATVPEVQERISYGTSVIFALRRDLVGFVAQDKHLSFFTMSPQLAKAMQDEIKATHKLSGATIHFSPENPLPESLVRKIIRARLEEDSR
jgi:uncharacterized protein YdhG (YjbR/CyaY superfamily)